MGFLTMPRPSSPTPSTSTATRSRTASTKAGDAVDKKTGGKYTEHIGTGVTKAQEGLDKLDGRRDDFSATTTEPAPDPDVVPSPGPDPVPDPAPVPTPSPDAPGIPTDPTNPSTGSAPRP